MISLFCIAKKQSNNLPSKTYTYKKERWHNMNRKTKIKIIITSLLLLIAIVTTAVINLNKETVTVSSTQLSNKKIGWGIKRNDKHEQPDVGKENRKILEEYGGICLGNSESKNIYLTFDEGYEAGYTEQILEVLKNNDVKATFFITAHYLNTQESLVKRMIDEGHIVGNHTVNHKSMPDLTQEEIKKEVIELHQAMYEKFNYDMKYIRPPKGEFSERTLNVINNLGYKTVMWSFAYGDWNEDKQPDEQKSLQKILNNLHNGEIMLLHGNSKTNTNILDSMIKEAKNMGYEFRSLDEFE